LIGVIGVSDFWIWSDFCLDELNAYRSSSIIESIETGKLDAGLFDSKGLNNGLYIWKRVYPCSSYCIRLTSSNFWIYLFSDFSNPIPIPLKIQTKFSTHEVTKYTLIPPISATSQKSSPFQFQILTDINHDSVQTFFRPFRFIRFVISQPPMRVKFSVRNVNNKPLLLKLFVIKSKRKNVEKRNPLFISHSVAKSNLSLLLVLVFLTLICHPLLLWLLNLNDRLQNLLESNCFWK
jgi:hypothetical protein